MLLEVLLQISGPTGNIYLLVINYRLKILGSTLEFKKYLTRHDLNIIIKNFYK